ncbi:hypothetical protein ACIHCM_13385 [Streptomyces sp. NPDC052023]|uniref:hypothetical protein n=1 Tax=Streptomyces sp. NPDC052023 TaxID=3365681 RepID=UPI0037D29815
MRSCLRWIHGRDQYVLVARSPTYMGETVAKFLILAFLIWLPVDILGWPDWIPFAGASPYLYWELIRVRDPLGELADQQAERDEHRRRKEQRDQP